MDEEIWTTARACVKWFGSDAATLAAAETAQLIEAGAWVEAEKSALVMCAVRLLEKELPHAPSVH